MSSVPDAPDMAPRRATVRLMLSHPAHAMALGFGSGLSPMAPGTVGTLWAWLAFLVMQPYLSPLQMAALLLAGFFVGWWACTFTARSLATPDPGSIVWDEVLAFWLVLWLVTPASLIEQGVAFALFRYFDAAVRRSAGRRASVSCSTTWLPPCAPCS